MLHLVSRRVVVLLAAALLLVTAGCPTPKPEAGNGSGGEGGNEGGVKLAFVTNGIASFWNVAAAGVKAGEKEFGVSCEVLMPPDGVADQKRMVEDLLARGVDGIAISPIDPANQTGLINQACDNTNVITQDSDAPETNRMCYIGMDNYIAGRMAGKLIKEAIPDGGSVMIFVGRLEQENARLRRQGVIDELLDRSEDRTRFDANGEPIKGDKYTVLDTRTDGFDFAKAKSLAEDALTKYDDLACMVGLFAYNPPKCLAAVKEAGKLDQVKIVAFDEEDETLQGIIDGEIYGTVVQNPFEYGRKSVEVLKALAGNDKSVIPESKFIDIPARQIRQDSVQEFWDDLKSKIDAAESKDDTAATETTEKVKVAFVTNNVSDFWKIAGAGVKKAESEFNAECEVLMPSDGTPENQQRLVENVIARGVSGMAISPNDAANQIEMLNRAAEAIHVITHDSDAPDSNRLCYVGTNNRIAGQEAGKLIKELLPDGGKIMLFVGRLDAQNAIDRSEGIKDVLKDSNIEIIDIRTDLADRVRAKQNVEDTLSSQDEVKCLVGLWSYNGPAILSAVKDAGLEGKMPIVCFDEESETLQGILDGHIHATVVQQPYEFGYQSVRILAALARGDQSVIPESKSVDVPVKVIKKDNAQAFWDDLKAKVGN